LQLVQAGNLRSAIDIVRLVQVHEQADRLLIASDTPTGTGVIPLALLRSMAELISLGGLPVEAALAAVTGNVAAAYGLNAGRISVGAPADLVVLDAPVGSAAADWRGALRIGDLPAVATVVTDAVIRLTRSRNTPPPTRPIRLDQGRPA
jgi:enamidase